MAQINYGIKAIKETEYFVDEFIELDEQSELNYNATIRSLSDVEEIHFTIMVHFKKRNTSQDFLRIKTTTVFIIQNMKEYSRVVDGVESINLPDPLWITLFSISFTHTRALLARSAASTKFSHMILPIINPDVEFRKIFAEHLGKEVSKS